MPAIALKLSGRPGASGCCQNRPQEPALLSGRQCEIFEPGPTAGLPRTRRVPGDDDPFAVRPQIAADAQVLENAADHFARTPDAVRHVLLGQALADDHFALF